MLRQKLFARLIRGRPHKVIQVHDQPYLARYYLGQLFGVQLWLHHFLSHDGERHFHDHPWNALSVVLSGGYREQIQLTDDADPWTCGIEHRNRAPLGLPAIISRWHRHRIISVLPSTWTLMLVAPARYKNWHFYHPLDGGVLERMQASGADWWRDCEKAD